jgi:hypothetical protein
MTLAAVDRLHRSTILEMNVELPAVACHATVRKAQLDHAVINYQPDGCRRAVRMRARILRSHDCHCRDASRNTVIYKIFPVSLRQFFISHRFGTPSVAGGSVENQLKLDVAESAAIVRDLQNPTSEAE